MFAADFLKATIWKVAFDILILLGPMALKKIINFVESEEPVQTGIQYSLLFFVLAMLQVCGDAGRGA